MNPQIDNLYQLAKKNNRRIVGLMSGTSLDGLDIALCHFEGGDSATQVTVENFVTTPYTKAFKEDVRKVFAKEHVSLPHLARLHEVIGSLHGKMVAEALISWDLKPQDVDLVASHGQTVMHSPKRLHQLDNYPNATLQIGDGDHVATACGIATLSDFRQKHIAVGGEGAPLALYGDFLLFSSLAENRVLVNIGGIANFTFLPKDLNFDRVFATDTGPGNTIIDAYVQKHFNESFDHNAQLALQGNCNQQLLSRLKSHKYFKEAVPKTTGPELFNLEYLRQCSEGLQLSHYDILNTLCHFTASTLTDAIGQFVNEKNVSIYLSGGGMHNPLITQLIATKYNTHNMDVLGVSGDAKEAVLFAALANQWLVGKQGFKSHFLKKEPFYMGKLSFPK